VASEEGKRKTGRGRWASYPKAKGGGGGRNKLVGKRGKGGKSSSRWPSGKERARRSQQELTPEGKKESFRRQEEPNHWGAERHPGRSEDAVAAKKATNTVFLYRKKVAENFT